MKLIPVKSFALAIVLGLSAPLAAQTANAQPGATPDIAARIDAVFTVHAGTDAPGCAVGVSLAGDIVFAKGYGMASLEHGVPITAQTAFDIGSVAKQFTAAAVRLLEQRGRLSLDNDVRRYVPELPDYGTPITLRNLLQHTSGLRDYGTLESLAGRHVRTMPEFIGLLARQRALNFVPGERHEYSHSDYSVLALAIERAAGEGFGQFIERELLQPLGMTSSRVHDSRGAAVPGRALAYAETGHGYSVIFPRNEIVGGAKLYTTVEDLLRWERNFHEPVVGGRALMDALVARPRLASGATIPYASGLRIGEYRGLPTVHRSGGGTFASEMLRFPEQRLAVVTLCNTSASHPRYLSQEVAALYLAEQMQSLAVVPARRQVETPQDELVRYAGVYRPLETPWNILRIAARDGALQEVFPDTSPPLTRIADGRYEADGFFYTFTQDANGGPLRLVLSVDEPVEVLERIPESELWQPAAAALEEFAGSFHSEELDASWSFIVLDGTLALRRRDRPDRALVPVSTDVFMQNLGAYERPLYLGLHFGRDAAGRISHLLVSTPGGDDAVKELRFERRTAAPQTSPAGDHRAHARRIATQAAAVRPGELVRIAGTAANVPFMEEIAVAVAAAGGHPLVTVFSDQTLRRWYQEVPARFDTVRDEWLWLLTQHANVEIRVGESDYSVYADIPPERLAAFDEANRGTGALRRERGTRRVQVGNGLYPSGWWARILGVELVELERIFDEGLRATPDELVAAGGWLRDLLRGASTVRIRHPNGTDITVGLDASSRIVLSDGTTTPPPRAPGTEHHLNWTWLPAGEVTLGLDPNRVDGRLVLERLFLDGGAPGPVTLTYAGGKLLTVESGADIAGFREYLASALPLSEQLTGLKFGLNPHVTDARVLPLMGAGMVSLSVGSNLVLGGDIDLPFLIFLTLAGATVHVDDHLVVDAGVLRESVGAGPTPAGAEPACAAGACPLRPGR